MRSTAYLAFSLVLIQVLPIILIAQPAQKARIMVLTDIEADPDDDQSMVRFLTYANQWDIEGLVATTSIHQKSRVAPESIEKILQAYNKVQPNLMLHEKGYPSYEQLKSKVKKGYPFTEWKVSAREKTQKDQIGS